MPRNAPPRKITLLIAAFAASTAVAGTLAGSPQTAEARDEPDPASPNIVLIVTDDQRADTLQTMPVVRKEIRRAGVDFTGVIPTSLCCPSRTAILSGHYSHTTGVYQNVGTHGGWQAFHDSGYEQETIATALDAAGYQTGLFGKYLNGWIRTPTDFVPPGWDEFSAMRNPNGNPELSSGAYYNYLLTGTDGTQVHGDQASDYSTDVTGADAVRFVDASVDGDPFFLMWTPFAPHPPFVPAERYVDSWDPRPYDNQAVNEEHMGDKPPFMQDRPMVPGKYTRKAQVQTGETLRSVDDVIGQLLAAAGPEAANTLFIFMSDNGFLWGEHREIKKGQPYRWSTEVPLMMRWDNRIPAGTSGGLAANIDVTETILDAANVPDAFPTEGISLLRDHRKHVLLESMEGQGRPAYCGVRTARWLYVQYSHNSAAELYDYRNDPLELRNLAGEQTTRDRQTHLRGITQSVCNPTPPGFEWTSSERNRPDR